MTVIIAGSRYIDNQQTEFNDYAAIDAALIESGFEITKIITGEALGVDRYGKYIAKQRGIPYQGFKPDWNDISHPDAVIKTNKFGKKYDALAGHRRNRRMAEAAEALIAIRAPYSVKSSGTDDMIALAKEMKLKVYVKVSEP